MLYLSIMPNKRLTISEETKILALLARGDGHTEIQRTVEREEGRKVALTTIGLVAARNAGTLQRLHERTLTKTLNAQQAIRDQANELIAKQLSAVERSVNILAHAGQQFLDGEITAAEYAEMAKAIKGAALTELVSVSKEMHAQTGKAPGSDANPEDSAAIRRALEEGDEVKITQLMFKKNPL